MPVAFCKWWPWSGSLAAWPWVGTWLVLFCFLTCRGMGLDRLIFNGPCPSGHLIPLARCVILLWHVSYLKPCALLRVLQNHSSPAEVASVTGMERSAHCP